MVLRHPISTSFLQVASWSTDPRALRRHSNLRVDDISTEVTSSKKYIVILFSIQIVLVCVCCMNEIKHAFGILVNQG